jgi:hypothetical protein
LNAFGWLLVFAVIALLGRFGWMTLRTLIGPRRGQAARQGIACIFLIVCCLVAFGSLGIQHPAQNTSAAPMPRPRPASSIAATAQPSTPDVKAENTLQAPLAISVEHLIAPNLKAMAVSGFSSDRQDALAQLAQRQCAGTSFCSVAIWTDAKNLPERLKMSGKQASSRIAQYVRNPHTHLERMLWDCVLLPHPAASCLSN